MQLSQNQVLLWRKTEKSLEQGPEPTLQQS